MLHEKSQGKNPVTHALQNSILTSFDCIDKMLRCASNSCPMNYHKQVNEPIVGGISCNTI